MTWKTKAFLQWVLERTPLGKSIYYLGQRHLGGLRSFRNYSRSRVENGISLLKCLHGIGEDIEGKSAFEIGTGWTPIIPLLFWLCGQDECYTYDISRLLRKSLLFESARQVLRFSIQPDITLERSRNKRKPIKKSKVVSLRRLVESRASASEILRNCNILYRAPADAGSTDLPNESIDLVYSNLVLGHVPQNEIHRLLAEAYRILHPGGYMLHSIDLTDQFAHADLSISTINFLQFSEEEFAKYNSYFCFQNRLREPTYRQILLDHGFEIVHWETRVDERALRELPRLGLHKDFLKLSAEQICTSSIRVVAKRP